MTIRKIALKIDFTIEYVRQNFDYLSLILKCTNLCVPSHKGCDLDWPHMHHEYFLSEKYKIDNFNQKSLFS